MLVWFFAFLSFLTGMSLVLGESSRWTGPFALSREKRRLRQVSLALHELEETLAVGLLPDPQAWSRLRELPAPWGGLAFTCFKELRDQGAAVLPTLRRMRELVQEHDSSLGHARAKSAQALAQAVGCAGLIPLLGFALYWLLPNLAEDAGTWILLCLGALASAGIGALWLFKLADSARWAGLAAGKRNWVLASRCAGERFLSLLRAGNPADIAWGKTCELLVQEAPALAIGWGYSIWKPDASFAAVHPDAPHMRKGGGLEKAILQAGDSLRKAVQVSLMEGRPCSPRVEAVIHDLGQETRAWMERELSVLPTKALKPLFICVAPAILGLIAAGLFLTWQRVL